MKDTLCWECENACGGCNWSRKKASPVQGWNAIRNDLVGGIESYVVISCPEFVSDGKEHKIARKQKGYRKWDSAQTLQLYRLRREGKTIAQCAEIMKRTKDSIKKKLIRDMAGGSYG